MHSITAFLQTQAGQVIEHRVGDMFRALGSPAEAEKQVAYLTFAITGAIFVVVASLIAFTIIRFRHRASDASRQEPPQVYGSNQIEVAWTVIPVLIVFVLLGVSARVIASVQNASPPKAMVKINVIGHQWWWEVYYPDYGIRTSNEIHIPVTTAQRPTAAYLSLQSQDVNHSFWVPQLSGKFDLIPNRTNYLWLDAKEPGVYFGNCAEYCGTQHAHMLLRVYADNAETWKQWTSQAQRAVSNNAQRVVSNNGQRVVSNNGQSAASTGESEGTHGSSNRPFPQSASMATVSSPGPRTNRQLFESLSCVNCHTVQDTSAIGKFGPDLTHLMSRNTIGAGVIDNNHKNLRDWVDDPQRIKPGCLMPSLKLTGPELDGVVAYLETLK